MCSSKLNILAKQNVSSQQKIVRFQNLAGGNGSAECEGGE